MKMKSVICRSVNSPLSLEKVDLADTNDDEVLVKIMASGVCASDIHVMTGQIRSPFPVVLGHEGAGIVEAVGKNVKTIKTGDKVALSWAPDCGACFYCDSGHSHLCDTSAPVVLDGGLLDGTSRLSQNGKNVFHYSFLSTWAEYAVVNEKSCVAIESDIDFAPASLIGCAVMTGFGAAVNTAQVKPGATVLVIGLGGVGLNIIQGAKVSGASKIIGVDINDNKKHLSEKFGLTHFIDARQSSLEEAVQEITKGLGVDYAFEAVGNMPLLERLFHLTRKRGTVVSVGIAPEDAKLELLATKLTRDEKKLTGCFYGSANCRLDFPKIIQLYEKGDILLDELIGQKITLDNINEAVDNARKGDVIRTVIEPHKTH